MALLPVYFPWWGLPVENCKSQLLTSCGTSTGNRASIRKPRRFRLIDRCVFPSFWLKFWFCGWNPMILNIFRWSTKLCSCNHLFSTEQSIFKFLVKWPTRTLILQVWSLMDPGRRWGRLPVQLAQSICRFLSLFNFVSTISTRHFYLE